MSGGSSGQIGKASSTPMIYEVKCPTCDRVRRARTKPEAARKALKACVVCANKSHGMTGSRLYHIWRNMRWRCGLSGHADHNKSRRHYKARGIIMCPEWATSFEAFQVWATANGYADDLVIDRRDNDGHYSPENCQWVGYTASNRNRRGVKLTAEMAAQIKGALARGEQGIAIARRFGVSNSTISDIRLNERWQEIKAAA
jgi:phage FluMu protein Com